MGKANKILVLRSWDEEYPQDSSVHLVTDEATLKSAEGKKQSKTFRSKKDYKKALGAVYDFHEQVHETVLALLKRKGDIELKRGIKFSFLEMEGTYTVHAVRTNGEGNDFYLVATGEDGDEYHIDWPQINHDMIVTEWLIGLKWPDTYPEYEY